MQSVEATWRRQHAGRVAIVFLAVLIVGYMTARIALHVASLVDLDRLVPVSGRDVVCAAPLMLVLWLAGTALVLRFPIPKAAAWYSLLFAVRIIVAILLSAIFQYDDERVFHHAAVYQVYGIGSFAAGRAYYHLGNVLYSIFGANILLPKVVNVFLGSLLPYFAFDIARWLFGNRKAGWRALLITGLFPPFIIFSAVNLKEIATGFCLVLIVWILLNPKKSYLWRFAGSGLCVWVLYWLRGAPWAMVGIMGVFGYYTLTMRLRFSSFMKVAGLAVLGGVLVVPPLLDQIQQMVWSRTTQEEYFITRFSGSEATVTRFVDVEDPLSGRNLAVLFLRGLFFPSPLRFFMDYGIGTQVEALNMLVWYVLFPLAVIAFLAYRRKGAAVACAVMTVGVLIIATMGIVVGGDPYRHRMVAAGLLASLAAGGVERDILRCFQWVIWLWVLGAAGFTGLWIALRLGG